MIGPQASIISPDANLALMQAAQGQTASTAERLDGKGLSPRTLKAIEETAQDFEAMFISEMMKPMFAGLEPDPLFGGGKGEKMFRGLLLQEYGKLFADSGGIGIADNIREELIRIQAGLLPENSGQTGQHN